MAGVRIQHQTERNVTFTLVDGARPYSTPFECAICHRVHEFKTYHLSLDETGATIVSLEIAERLRRLGPATGFAIGEEIAAPPPQIVVPGAPYGGPVIARSPVLVDPR